MTPPEVIDKIYDIILYRKGYDEDNDPILFIEYEPNKWISKLY